jgi:peptidoglycan/xylan/chitin deacetylase (PgdA/CDA1 family)
MEMRRLQVIQPEGAAAEPPNDGANDAFSFWKLPESWRPKLSETIGPSAVTAETCLLERYLPAAKRRPPAGLRPYYLIKRAIPISIRHRLKSMMVKRRSQVGFPAWPSESMLVTFWRDWLHQSLVRLGVSDAWHIGFWPEGKECCVVLTHDIESPLGMERIEEMAELEDRYGFRSAWNVPLAQYPVDWARVERLRSQGFEFGAHGLNHDGKLFRSRKDFLALSRELEMLAHEHSLRGFRSPSTLRQADWIQSMDFDYDSSFSDTDPFEPQPGGTCSVFPFFMGPMVELPYTLPQDHTLIYLLQQQPTRVWDFKIKWIAALGGMILVLVHPDYCWTPQYRHLYEDLLRRLSDLESAWRALPSEVAAWWRRRDALTLNVNGDEPCIVGPDTSGALAKRLSCERLAQFRTVDHFIAN